MTKEISSSDDIIDVQSVIKRVEELQEIVAGEDKVEEECDELRSLESLLNYLCDFSGALIRDSYFEDYARELAGDIHGRSLREADWPFDCIDWQKAADELQMDYRSLKFDGVTYWYR